jgi:hypothetical protein
MHADDAQTGSEIVQVVLFRLIRIDTLSNRLAGVLRLDTNYHWSGKAITTASSAGRRVESVYPKAVAVQQKDGRAP